MSQAQVVSLSTFEDQVVNSEVPVIVDFYADWCGPCRALGPVLDRVATSYSGRAKVVKVNVDQEPELANHFNVSSIPTLVFFNKGRIVGKSSGLASEASLTGALDKMIGAR